MVADAAPKSADYLCQPCAEHFKALQKYLNLLGLPFTMNHRLVRGLDYYTRTVFEIQPEAEGGQSTIGGGGRYDNLIAELGGKPTPAIGFATGMERIVLNLKNQNIPVPPLDKPEVFIAFVGNEAIKLASRLRQVGIGVVGGIGNKSLKAQLRQANTLGVRHSIILGEQELKDNTAILRDMTSAQQEIVPLTRLEELLK